VLGDTRVRFSESVAIKGCSKRGLWFGHVVNNRSWSGGRTKSKVSELVIIVSIPPLLFLLLALFTLFLRHHGSRSSVHPGKGGVKACVETLLARRRRIARNDCFLSLRVDNRL